MKNLDKEWKFITTEVHREKPNKRNLLKRNVLFTMQILLTQRNTYIYSKLKEIYLKCK
ncbi:MAG: hypothetical protein LBT79_04770 [Elusimicrobiota bacterium]|jgi:hypothetical protein|nr:hypothetical protein [Elusimicrobiota bacterium]